jgi:hypothetical protein
MHRMSDARPLIDSELPSYFYFFDFFATGPNIGGAKR